MNFFTLLSIYHYKISQASTFSIKIQKGFKNIIGICVVCVYEFNHFDCFKFIFSIIYSSYSNTHLLR